MFEELSKGIQFLLSQHDWRLENPQGLLLLAAIPVFIVLGMFMGRDISWYRRWIVQLLRVALVAALAVAYAQPVKISKEKAPAVVILADLSESVSPQSREEMQDKIQDLWSQKGRAAAFLVGFGGEPVLLARPEHRRVSLFDLPGGDITDIASALRFTYGLFPQQHDRRVVVFSDGEENRGDLRAEALRARELGIAVSAVPVTPASVVDVRVDKVTAPAAVREGRQVPVEVEITSNARKSVLVRLVLDGQRAASRRMRLVSGVNRADFSVLLEGEGWHRLTASMVGVDRYPENNRAACRVYVLGRPRVLLVRKTDEPNPLQALLKKQDIQLQSATIDTLPERFKDLARQDLIILDDLALPRLTAQAMENLKAYVEEYGGGLIATAGAAASELTGPKDYAIEALLPVHFRQVKKKEKIPAALVFVMDRSSSMARLDKFSILLRAVMDALGRMKDSVQVSLVMFDDFPEVVVPLTEARQRKKIRKILMSQRVGGGTSIYPALEQAHSQLKKSAARLKHVILLSDGQSISMFAQYGYIVEKMARDRITITTVALGKDADQPELKRIAGRTEGRFYFTTSMANVPRIFTAETENLTESDVVEQPIKAVAAKQVEVLAGIDFATSPELGGYLASEARPTSEVLLHSSDRSEPLLTRWRFGLGRVTVWTTDAQGAWAQAWTQWEGFKRLWPRLVQDNLRSSTPGDIRLHGQVEEDRAILSVRVPAERPEESATPPRLVAFHPQGRQTEVATVRRGLGLYRGELQLTGLGPYAFRAERTGRRGALERSYASLSRTYKEEYLSSGTNLDLLRGVTRITGGTVDPSAEEIFAPGRQERQERKEGWPPFLYLAIGLFLSEIFVRRI